MASLATTATALLALAVPYASAINLKVSSSGGNASSPLLYGLMIEDISKVSTVVFMARFYKTMVSKETIQALLHGQPLVHPPFHKTTLQLFLTPCLRHF